MVGESGLGRPPDAYERGLERLRAELLAMGGMAADLLAKAVESLSSGDREAAGTVLGADDEVDDREERIELGILDLLGLKEPRPEDLRYLYGLGRMARDLERIADYAGDLAEIALELPAGTALPPGLPEMGEEAVRMLQDFLRAVFPPDAVAATEVAARDDRVDALYLRVREEILAGVREDPDRAEAAVSLVLADRYLERVADHVVNLAEGIIFWQSGRRRVFRRQKPWLG